MKRQLLLQDILARDADKYLKNFMFGKGDFWNLIMDLVLNQLCFRLLRQWKCHYGLGTNYNFSQRLGANYDDQLLSRLKILKDR